MKIELKTTFWEKGLADGETGVWLVSKLTWVYGILALIIYASLLLFDNSVWSTIAVVMSLAITFMVEKSGQKYLKQRRKDKKVIKVKATRDDT